MDKNQFYSVPETKILVFQNSTAIMAQSSEVGTTPFQNEELEYTL